MSKKPASQHSLSLKNRSTKSSSTMRDKSTVKRLQMYRGGKPTRDSSGRITKQALFQERLASGTNARVAPNRQWFNNSRVVTQSSLQKFQSALKNVVNDPYQIVMKQTKLPITLLNEKQKQKRVHILDVESYEKTFGPKAQRKRINTFEDMESLMDHCQKRQDEYQQDKDQDLMK
ncbi:unnamed protein product, partial [Didymodactylos carnosus]